METKICPKCLQEFPRNTKYFHRHRQSKDGFKCWCKKCNTAASCDWGKNNPEKKKTQNNRVWNKQSENLEDKYIKHQMWRTLGLPFENYSTEIIEVKRNQLKLHRLCQQI